MTTEYYKEKLQQGLYFQDYIMELLYKKIGDMSRLKLVFTQN